MSRDGVTPAWLAPLVRTLPDVRREQLSPLVAPASGGRHSAVLVLFSEGVPAPGGAGPDVLLIERAHTLRSHAGQPAFPGGALDPEDGDPAGDGPVAAALREAAEEVGLQPSTVSVLGVLPALWLPPSGFLVHPVLAWWREPHPVSAADPAEVAAVARVPLAELADPAHRVRVRHPSGWAGPAFEVQSLLVWGFTAALVDRLLALGGWERPWDSSRVRTLDAQTVALSIRGSTFPAGRPELPPGELLPLAEHLSEHHHQESP